MNYKDKKNTRSLLWRTLLKPLDIFIISVITLVYFSLPILIFRLTVKETRPVFVFSIFYFLMSAVFFIYIPFYLVKLLSEKIDKSRIWEEIKLTPEYKTIREKAIRNFLIIILITIIILSLLPSLVYFSIPGNAKLTPSMPLLSFDLDSDWAAFPPAPIDLSFTLIMKSIIRTVIMSFLAYLFSIVALIFIDYSLLYEGPVSMEFSLSMFFIVFIVVFTYPIAINLLISYFSILMKEYHLNSLLYTTTILAYFYLTAKWMIKRAKKRDVVVL